MKKKFCFKNTLRALIMYLYVYVYAIQYCMKHHDKVNL